MLLVLGFGKSLVAREHSESGPPGMVYFNYVAGAISDIRTLYKDPLLLIEVLFLSTTKRRVLTKALVDSLLH